MYVEKKLQALLLFAITAGTALAAPQPSVDCITPGETTTGTTLAKHTKTPSTTVGLSQTSLSSPSSPLPTSSSASHPATRAAGAARDDEPDWQGIAAKWRAALGKAAWKVNGTLVANALKTARDGHGKMRHELNPGSLAQVLAPGDEHSDYSFEAAFVGGWLCEIPTLPGLGDACEKWGPGWKHGETGHAEILSSEGYNSIGCAWDGGIWACDLGNGV
ncbi:hypothetical protein SLS62_003440 [Diatrype stigma]|uniref:SCP domain-containing protein n=1 Tax=Diatrype stigma TaxID=117547 RepID=A0AAN9YRG8_9PEZI